jgi:hypothetical protein
MEQPLEQVTKRVKATLAKRKGPARKDQTRCRSRMQCVPTASEGC